MARTEERAEWVRAWFAERYTDPGVFVDGAEALTLEAACQLVSDAQAAERERCAKLCEEWAAVRSPEHGGLALRNVAERIRGA
jgi:hypothetical protein